MVPDILVFIVVWLCVVAEFEMYIHDLYTPNPDPSNIFFPVLATILAVIFTWPTMVDIFKYCVSML